MSRLSELIAEFEPTNPDLPKDDDRIVKLDDCSNTNGLEGLSDDFFALISKPDAAGKASSEENDIQHAWSQLVGKTIQVVRTDDITSIELELSDGTVVMVQSNLVDSEQLHVHIPMLFVK